ncbi:MAG: hypothetical protein CM15mP103_08090 [Gammaproteobacteria bacterium]|nr:MAG: hypothetical protein CM15mP103_08090 [Gammaproteobacteria bacterium]
MEVEGHLHKLQAQEREEMSTATAAARSAHRAVSPPGHPTQHTMVRFFCRMSSAGKQEAMMMGKSNSPTSSKAAYARQIKIACRAVKRR